MNKDSWERTVDAIQLSAYRTHHTVPYGAVLGFAYIYTRQSSQSCHVATPTAPCPVPRPRSRARHSAGGPRKVLIRSQIHLPRPCTVSMYVRYMYYVEPSPALMRILFALPTDRSTAVKKRASASMACVHSCPPNRPRASACTSSGAPSPTATPRELTPGDAETPGSLYASPQGSAYSTTGSVSRSLTPSSAPFLAKRIVAQLTFPASKRLS